MTKRRILPVIAGMLSLSIALTACGGAEPAPTAVPTVEEEAEHVDEGEHMDEQMDEEEHMDEDMHPPEDHMEGAHDVPDAAAAVPNPLSGDEAATEAGGELYAANCALCHGETGEGDGPAATGMEPPPADLHADHVQGLSDGALFYIISHGRPDTPMPAWENQLTEDERWQVVNYLRTFQ